MNTQTTLDWIIVISSAILIGYIIAHVLNIGCRMMANYLWKNPRDEHKVKVLPVGLQKVANDYYAEMNERLNLLIHTNNTTMEQKIIKLTHLTHQQTTLTDAEHYVEELFEGYDDVND